MEVVLMPGVDGQTALVRLPDSNEESWPLASRRPIAQGRLCSPCRPCPCAAGPDGGRAAGAGVGRARRDGGILALLKDLAALPEMAGGLDPAHARTVLEPLDDARGLLGTLVMLHKRARRQQAARPKGDSSEV